MEVEILRLLENAKLPKDHFVEYIGKKIPNGWKEADEKFYATYNPNYDFEHLRKKCIKDLKVIIKQ